MHSFFRHPFILGLSFIIFISFLSIYCVIYFTFLFFLIFYFLIFFYSRFLYTVAQKERIFFQIIVTSFISNIKKIMLTPKQPVINSVLITYIDYSITENYIGNVASFLPYKRPEPLLKVLHHIY